MTYTLHHGDCLDILPTLADKSVDAIIADPPYGTTACKWDSVIPFAPMWKELRRIIRPRGAIVLFGSQPFTSALVMSWPQGFKYDVIWSKVHTTGQGNAKIMPLRAHESILIFALGRHTYNPQMIPRTPLELKRLSYHSVTTVDSPVYRTGFAGRSNNRYTHTHKHPNSVVRVHAVHNRSKDKTGHPSEKPLDLLEYLVKTYTHEGDTVLDFTMGSGTTGEACITTGRDFIGIEKEQTYYDIAARRLDAAAARMVQMELAV